MANRLLFLSSLTLFFTLVAISVYFLLNQTRLANLETGQHAYKLQVAKTTAEQEKGLGGRPSMPANEGMLFVFKGEATRCFWMKNMRFPLDMVWLDSGKKVVALLQDVLPQTYPKAFCPENPAQYVIELDSGQVNAANIKVGNRLHF